MASAGDGAPRFKSIKSLPVDYRYDGSSAEKEKSGSNNSSMISVSIPENGVGNMDRGVDDDSPYGQNSNFLLNDRPSTDDDDVNPSVSSQGSVLPSWGNKKWGDTASYVAKKVNLLSKLQFFLFI